jgi:hypothetical protein
VLEVLGFRFKGERVLKIIATIDDLEDADKQIKILGQIICLSSSPKKESWDWNRHYMPLDIDSQDNRLTHCQYVLELASVLAYPLAPTLVTKPPPSSKLEESNYPTWRIPSEQLESALDALWDSLEPESERILGNVTLLLSITNPAALPYPDINGNESLLVKDIPDCLLPHQKHSGKDILPCFLCGKSTILKDIRNHVGGHILRVFCESDGYLQLVSRMCGITSIFFWRHCQDPIHKFEYLLSTQMCLAQVICHSAWFTVTVINGSV